MSQWVQHISGQGEKWELFFNQADCDDKTWRVNPRRRSPGYYLPKSEYILVEPEKVEKVWRNVTHECEFSERGNHLILPCHVVSGAHTYTKIPDGYRLRKARAGEGGWRFVVERFQV